MGPPGRVRERCTDIVTFKVWISLENFVFGVT